MPSPASARTDLPISEERAAAAPSVPPKPAQPRAVSVRAVVLGFLLVPLNSLWVAYSEAVRRAAHPTATSLFFNVVLCILMGDD